VEITLTAGRDRAVPSGSLNILYSLYGNGAENESPLVQKSIPIVNGKATADFPVPNKLIANPTGLVGYWFKEQEFDLPAEPTPLAKIIEVTPAGAIHGRVTAEVGLRDKLFTVTSILIKAPRGMDHMNLSQDYVQRKGSDRYLTSSLPLGGIYAVLLKQGTSTYTVSPPIALDLAHPVATCDLHEIADSVIRGKFVDANKRPVALESVSLTYHPTDLCSFSNVAARTERDGTFTIPNMNFHVPGHYELQLDAAKWAPNTVLIDGKTQQPITIMAHRRISTR
jgi:hypothetical protein